MSERQPDLRFLNTLVCPGCKARGEIHPETMDGYGHYTGDELLLCESCSVWDKYEDGITANVLLRLSKTRRWTPQHVIDDLHEQHEESRRSGTP